jgi:hypothetical protein
MEHLVSAPENFDSPNPRLAEEQAKMRARYEDTGAHGVDPNVRPYTIDDLMILHNWSRQTVIRRYENEVGVEILTQPQRKPCTGKRTRRMFRVPRHVYVRVRDRLRTR